MPFPSSFQEHFALRDLLLRHSTPESSAMGLVTLPEGPMLVSSRPIPDSANDNPVGGTMLFARHLDDAQTAALAKSTKLNVDIRQALDKELPPDFQLALRELRDPEPIFIRRFKEDEVSAYTFVDDIYGDPSIVVRVDMPSTIYQQGLTTLNYLMVSVALVGLFFSLVTILGLQRFVLSRVIAVRGGVDSISRTKDVSRRLSVGGHDELSGLANDVNRMLDELEAAEQQVQVQNRTLRQLNQRLAEAQESERRDIAQRLHDDFGQELTALHWTIESAKKTTGSQAAELLDRAGESVTAVIEAMRTASMNLYPTVLEDLGLVAALEWLVENFESESSLTVELIHTGIDSRFSPKLESAAFRIVQEGLSNVARHARTNRAWVTMSADENLLRLEIGDRGVGFDTDALKTESSLGLDGASERVESLQGHLRVQSAPGQGTVLDIEIPLPVPDTFGPLNTNRS